MVIRPPLAHSSPLREHLLFVLYTVDHCLLYQCHARSLMAGEDFLALNFSYPNDRLLVFRGPNCPFPVSGSDCLVLFSFTFPPRVNGCTYMCPQCDRCRGGFMTSGLKKISTATLGIWSAIMVGSIPSSTGALHAMPGTRLYLPQSLCDFFRVLAPGQACTFWGTSSCATQMCS